MVVFSSQGEGHEGKSLLAERARDPHEMQLDWAPLPAPAAGCSWETGDWPGPDFTLGHDMV